jgi:transcriptional regulator with XRE-family HTH domain
MRLASLLTAWRHHEEMSVREAAKRIGIPSSTYQRVERGLPANGETLTQIWRWLLE